MKDTDCLKYRFAVPLRQHLRNSKTSSTQAESLTQAEPLPQASLPQAEASETSLLGSNLSSNIASNLPTRQGILIRLHSADGFVGWGQAMPHSGVLTDANETEISEVALDAASYDLASRRAEMPLCDWLRLESSNSLLGGSSNASGANDTSDANDASDAGDTEKVLNGPAAIQTSPKAILLNALIFGATPEEVAEAGKLAAVSGFPAVKLKVGGTELQVDIPRVRALREAVGSKVAIRLDANGAWQPDEALLALRSLAPFDIEYIEEPTAGLAAISQLAGRSPIALAADESIKSIADLPKLPQLGISVAVVKPAVLGNLRLLLAACQQLVSNGVKVTVSSALDSSIGIACAAHFAAALGLSDTPCGLATAQWLADDLAHLPEISEGHLNLPKSTGIGIAPLPAALERLCSPFEEDVKMTETDL